jgi:xanthine dehydrogenase accessory factor
VLLEEAQRLVEGGRCEVFEAGRVQEPPPCPQEPAGSEDTPLPTRSACVSVLSIGAGALPFLAAAVKEILDTLERWKAEGLRVATATVVKTERSAPRDPGAMLAVSERGEVAGSVTGGCVEPAVYEEAREVLAGGAPRLRTYGIADDEAFEVGLPCGGTVHIFVDALDETMLTPLAEALREERPIALEVAISGPRIGAKRLVSSGDGASGELLARGETAIVETDEGELFVNSFAPRPEMYVFGAVDHAAAVAQVGRFLGYRVTICDARARFATKERFPDVDELVVEWPDRFLSQAPVDERTVICVLTHDHKFDVPLLKVALETNAGYIGAMGSRRTNEARAEALKAEGVTDEQLARVKAPIGLDIGSRTPEEVAIAVAAEVVGTFRKKRMKEAAAV